MDIELDFKKVNLYEILDISPTAEEIDIRKAYRKKALIYHPDKNRGDPKANEIFQKLSKVLEILLDGEARASYDKILNAKKEREIRNKQLDATTRKFRDDLERREKAAKEAFDIQAEEERLKREIDRIRKKSAKRLEEEQELLRKKIEEEKAQQRRKTAEIQNRIKISKPSNCNFAFNEETLSKLFRPFGIIENIATSNKTAIIEYQNCRSPQLAKQASPQGLEVEILSVKPYDSPDEDLDLENYEKFVFGLIKDQTLMV